MSKTVLFLRIQFSISTQFISIGPYQVLPLRGQSRPRINGNKVVFCIPQSSSITGASPSDCLVSYTGHLLGGGGVLPLCRDAVSVF